MPNDQDTTLSKGFLEQVRRETAFFLDTFWRFNDSQWRELPLEILQGELVEFVQRTGPAGVHVPRRLLRTIPEMMRASLAASLWMWNTDPDLLPCLNGLLHIADRTLTELSANSRVMRTCVLGTRSSSQTTMRLPAPSVSMRGAYCAAVPASSLIFRFAVQTEVPAGSLENQISELPERSSSHTA